MYKLVSAVFVGFVGLTNAVTKDELLDALNDIITDSNDILRLQDYIDFVDKFNKLENIDITNVDELKDRFINWKETDDNIELKNSKSSDKQWTMGHTRFSDWSLSEKQSIVLDEKYINTDNTRSAVAKSNCLQVTLTDSSISSDEYYYNIDNRDYDIAGIQDQGQCASCWDFSDVATMEINRNIDFGYTSDNDDSFVKLSEQMVLDCISDDIGTCDGGYPILTMMWALESGGISQSTDYDDYAEVEGTCDDTVSTSTASNFDQMFCLADETAEQAAYAASSFSVEFAFQVYSEFYNYDGGVYSCDTTDEFMGWHAVTMVGVTEEYFLVKNSWSTSWGDDGYFKISRDSFDDCSMSHFAFVSFNNLKSSLTTTESTTTTTTTTAPTMDLAKVASLRKSTQSELRFDALRNKINNEYSGKNNVHDNNVHDNNLEKEENIPGMEKIKVHGKGNYTILIVLGSIVVISLLLCFGGLLYKAFRNCYNKKQMKAIVNAHEESALLDGYTAL